MTTSRQIATSTADVSDRAFYGVWWVYKRIRLLLGVVILCWGAGKSIAGETPPIIVDFTLTDLMGETRSASDYRGRWVVVNFWATWCGPCIREIPELIAFRERYIGAVEILGIAFEKTPTEQIRSFAQEFKINYPILLIGDEPILPLEPLKGLPSTFLLSPDGHLLKSHVGPVSAEQLDQWLEAVSSKAN